MMPSESGAESRDPAAAQMGTDAASAVATAGAAGGGPDPEAASVSLGRHQSQLSWPQVKRLDALLSEPIPIHGRGNFPTLSVQPRQIVQVRGAGPGGGREPLLQGTWNLRLAWQLGKLRNRERELCSFCTKLVCPGSRGKPLLPENHSPRPWRRSGWR